MRKIQILVLTMLLVMLSGCTVYIDQEIEIENNNSGEIIYTVALDDEMFDTVEGFLSESMDELEEENEGLQVEEYDEDGKKGFTLTYEFEDLDDLAQLLADDDIVLTYTENDDETVSVEIVYPEGEESTEGMESTVEYTITIKVPNEKSNNADEVKRNTLTWEFDDSEETTLEFTYGQRSPVGLILLIAGILLVSAGLGYGGYKVYKSLIKDDQVPSGIE